MKGFINIVLFVLLLLINNYSKIYSQEINFQELTSPLQSKSKKEFTFVSKNSIIKINPTGELIDSISFKNINDYKNHVLLYNENYFLINTLGGQVYKSKNSEFERIDNSFTHKNQLRSSIFVYDGIIYRFGGYGFFGSRNFLTFFSNETNEWEVLKTKSRVFPPGLFDNKFFIHDNELHVFGGFTLDNNDREKRLANKEYWKFSFIEKSWSKIGESNLFENSKQNNFDFYDNGEFYFVVDGKLFILYVNSNKIISLEKSKTLDKTNFNLPAFKLNDTIYFVGSSPNSETAKYNIYKIPINDMLIDKTFQIEKDYYHYFLILLLIGFAISFIRKNNFLKKKLKISNGKIFYGFKRIKLNGLELKFLEKLINKQKIENNELIKLINSKLDISQKTRIKNDVINSLNIKLEIISNSKFSIKKYSSQNDRRYYSYQLIKT